MDHEQRPELIRRMAMELDAQQLMELIDFFQRCLAGLERGGWQH
jgi:hypothetical protein